MKRFILHCLAFFTIAMVLLASVTLFVNIYISRKARFKIRDEAKYVVLGNSHPEQAFNDSLIDHFQNLSQAAETYLYTYLKAQEIVEQNQQIEVVFIDFSNTDLLPEWNKWIWGSQILTWRYPIYSPFMGIREEKLLFMKNFSELNNCLSLAVKDNLGRILHHDLNYSSITGGFVYNTRAKADSMLAVLDLSEEFKKYEKEQEQISVYNMTYLERLLQYLRKKNKKIFLIGSPLHKRYPGWGNEWEFEKLLHEKFKDYEYLDFRAFPLLNEDYVDLEHVNYRGARKFSIWFNELIKEGLLEKENKQAFIDLKMKALE